MAYDPKLTEAMVAWLRAEHTDDESIRKGAEMLLSVNRNRGLFASITRNPRRGLKKLEYEIRKHVNIRLAGYTVEDIIRLDEEVTPQVGAAVAETERVENQVRVDFDGAAIEPVPLAADDGSIRVVTGRRPDHDSLPVEIQGIWTANAERWKKIKATFELLKTLDVPCDRYEHLQLLKETWYKYKTEMARYDDYRSGDIAGGGRQEEGGLPPEQQRDVDNAQSYISRYLPVLKELAEAAKEEGFADGQKLEEQRAKIQDRVDILLKAGVTILDQRKADLASCDIRTELTGSDAEG